MVDCGSAISRPDCAIIDPLCTRYLVFCGTFFEGVVGVLLVQVSRAVGGLNLRYCGKDRVMICVPAEPMKLSFLRQKWTSWTDGHYADDAICFL